MNFSQPFRAAVSKVKMSIMITYLPNGEEYFDRPDYSCYVLNGNVYYLSYFSVVGIYFFKMVSHANGSNHNWRIIIIPLPMTARKHSPYSTDDEHDAAGTRS